MTNDSLTAKYTGGENGQVLPNPIDNPVTPDVTGLPQYDRATPNFNYNSGGLGKQDRITIPGYGAMPFVGQGLYPNLNFNAEPLSGTTIESSNQTTDPEESEQMAMIKAISSGNGKDTKPEHDAIATGNRLFGSDIKSEYTTGLKVEDYKDYTPAMNMYADNDDLRAIHQSNAQVCMRGAVRFGATTIQAFAEPFVNLGALVALSWQEDKKLSFIYDNAVTRSMDEINDKIKQSNAIFSTKTQQNAGTFSAENLTSAHLWAEGVADGLGFTVGTLLNAWATAGLGSVAGSAVGGAAKMIGLGSKSATAVAVAETAEVIANIGNNVDDLAQVGRILNNPTTAKLVSKTLELSKNGLSKVGTIGKATSKMLPSFMAASAEGGVEARGLKAELKPILDAQVRKGEITQAQADSDLEWAMNTTYGLNVAIVGLSTHIQFAGLIARGGKQVAKTANVGINTERVLDAAGKTVGKVNKLGAKTWSSSLGVAKNTYWGKALDLSEYGYIGLKNPISEMTEEGLQFVVSGAVKDHYAFREGHSYYESIANATNELFHTKEGKENLLIGGIIGIAGAGSGVVSSFKERKFNNTVANKLNDVFLGKDSRIRMGISHYGRVVDNNKKLIKSQDLYTQSVADANEIEFLDEAYAAEIADYAHKTGTVDIVKKYINKFNNLSDEEFATEFPTMANMDGNTRKESINKLVNTLDEQVAIRKEVDNKYAGFEDHHKDLIYRLQSFHHKTDNLYMRQIDNLREKHGIDVVALNKKAVTQYEDTKQKTYALEKAKAFDAYKASLPEATTGISAAQFNTQYDLANEAEFYKNYDANLATNISTRQIDENGDMSKVTTTLKGDVTAHITMLTNQLVEESINNKAGKAWFAGSASEKDARTLFDNYENLQQSYLDSYKTLSYLTNPANKEVVEKGYAETKVQLVAQDVDRTWKDKVKAVNKNLRTAKADDVASVEGETTALTTQLNARIAILNNLLANSNNLSTGDVISYEAELSMLNAYVRNLSTSLTDVKNKFKPVTPAATNTAEAPVEASETGAPVAPEVAPETKVAPGVASESETVSLKGVDKTAEALSKTLTKIVNRLDTVKNGLKQRANSAASTLVNNFEEKLEDYLYAVEDLKGSLTVAKDEDAVNEAKGVAHELQQDVNRFSDKIEQFYNAYLKDLDQQDAAIKAEKDKAEAATTKDNIDAVEVEEETDDSVEFGSEVLVDRFNIQGNNAEEQINNIVSGITDIFNEDGIDTNDTARHTIGNQESAPKLTFKEYALALFGDGHRQRGVLQDYIAEKYGKDRAKAMYEDPYSAMKIVYWLFTKNNPNALNETSYRQLFHEYRSANAHLKVPLETARLSELDYLLVKINTNEFISDPFNIKASDFLKQESHQSVDEYQYDLADMVQFNRESVKGNETAERANDTDVVFTNATASLQLADMNIEVNGKAINARQLVNQLKNEQFDASNDTVEVTYELLGELPITVLNSNGESIGHIKTFSELEALENAKKLTNSRKGYAAEKNKLMETRLQMLYNLINNPNDNYAIDTKIDRVGKGYMEKAGEGSVAKNIKVPGTKVLVARDNTTNIKLIDNGDHAFEGVIGNSENFNDKLKNGISYVAVPAGTTKDGIDNPVGEPIYMVMPAQSTKLGGHKGAVIGDTYNRTHADTRTNEEGKTKIVDKTNTISERIKMSIISALNIYIKISKGETLTKAEQTIKDSLANVGYDVADAIGLNEYVRQFIHTYYKTPIDISQEEGSEISIDNIMNSYVNEDNENVDRIKESEVSVVRIKNKMIEIGTVKDGVVNVVSILVNNGKVSFANYSFRKNGQAKADRTYKLLVYKDYQHDMFRSIYNALDNAFMRVDADLLNDETNAELGNDVSFKRPLVNLVEASTQQTIENGSLRTVLTDSVVNEEDPIQMDAISFDTYDDYAKNILNTDVKSSQYGEKHVYSKYKAIHVNTENLAEGKDFDAFKNKIKKVLDSRKGSAKLIPKFSTSDIANFTLDSNSVFANKFKKAFANISQTHNIVFGNNGFVSFISKDGSTIARIDLSKYDSTIDDEQLSGKLVLEIGRNSVPNTETTVALIQTSVKATSPVKKETEKAKPAVQSTPKAPEQQASKASVVDELTPDYTNTIDLFAYNLENDPSTADSASQYVKALISQGMSPADAQSAIDDVINNISDKHNTIGNFDESPVRRTPGVINKRTLKIEDTSVKKIAVDNKVLNEDGSFVEFNTADRALHLADRVNKALSKTAYTAKVIEKVSNAVTVKYIIFIDKVDTNTDIFGENNVALMNAINENKGFIPFVSPRDLNAIRNRLSNAIFDILASETSNKDSVKELFEKELANWKFKANSMKAQLERTKLAAPNSPVLACLEDGITMYNSLIENSNVVKDIVLRDLAGDSMIKYNSKTGDIATNSTKLSFLTGNLENADDTEVTEDDDSADYVAPDTDDEGEEDNDSDTDKENNAGWHLESIAINHRDNASAVIKRFLRGIRDVRNNKAGKAVYIKDSLGNDQYLNYIDVYNKVLRRLCNKPHDIQSIIDTLKTASETDPVFGEILAKFEKELANPRSAVAFEFAKLVNKTRVEMKYAMINLNATDKLQRPNGLVNQIGNSNKSDIKNIIMSQWNAHFIESDFVDTSEDNTIVANAARIKQHISNFSIKTLPITELIVTLNNINPNDTSFKSINKKIKAYNELISKNIDTRPGYSYFKQLNEITNVKDIDSVKSEVNRNIHAFVNELTKPVGFVFSSETIDNLIKKQRKVGSEGIVKAFLNENNNNFRAVLNAIIKEPNIDFASSSVEHLIRKPISLMLAIESQVNNGVDPITYRDKTNKAVYSYTNYKYMDEVLSELQEADGTLVNDIKSTAFGRNCHLLRSLTSKVTEENADDNSSGIRFAYSDSLQVMGKNGKTETVKLDQAREGDIEVFKLLNFYNRGNKDGMFFYPTLSDGKSIMSLPMAKQTSLFVTDSNGKVSLSPVTIAKAFELIVQPEIDRIATSTRLLNSGVKINIAGYADGASHFILNNYLNDLLAVHTVKQTSEDGKVTTSLNLTDDAIETLTANARKKFESFLYKTINDKIELWKTMGIVNKGESRDYMYIMDDKSGKDTYPDKNPFKVAADFEINNLIFNMGVNQIFMGDTAAYWSKSVNATIDNMSKRLAGHRGPGEIGATATRKERFNYVTVSNAKVASEAKTWLDSILSKRNNDPKATADLIDSTDGQELTSMYEDLYNRVNYNGLSRALFNALYHDEDAVIFKAFERMFAKNASKEDENLDYETLIVEHLKRKDREYVKEKNPNASEEEINTLVKNMTDSIYAEYMKMVYQPVKPMYFGTESREFGNGEVSARIRTATYIKSSSFALRPSVTKGFGIDKVRKSLDYGTYQFLKEQRDINKDEFLTDSERAKALKEARAKMIDRFSFDSAIKLGASTDKISIQKHNAYDEDASSYKDLYDTMSSSATSLARKGFRIQQDLPFKHGKDKIGVGSQERKLLFNGFGEVEALKELKARYDSLYNDFYKIGYDRLMEELLVDGEVNYEKLSEIAIEEGITRNYDDNDIAELRTNENGDGFESRIMFHRKDTAIESLMMSIVNSRVIKMKFPGRSFVLGTESGFSKFADNTVVDHEIKDPSSIIFTNSFKGKLASHGFRAKQDFTTKDGTSYKVDDYIAIQHLTEKVKDEDYYYQPDQIIIPSYFKDNKGRMIDLKKGYNGKDGKYDYITVKNGKMTLRDDKFDPETLKTFGFRIPTQGHSSMASMEVVGFTDTNVGELVIATRDFVYRMGSDFDIDKLYMYRYAIEEKDKTFTKNTSDAKYGIINEIIDIHHRVFETPDETVQQSIASPLSYGFFNQEYKPDSSVSDLYEKYSKDKDSYYIGEFIEDLLGEETQSLSPLTSTYQSNFYQKGKMGKDGIAIFSSRSVVNAVLQQSMFNGNRISMGATVTTKDGTAFDAGFYDFRLAGYDFKGTEFGNNKTVDGSGYTVGEVISWYQSTAVDNAKLNKLHKLNINDTTIDVVNFLNQAGFQEQVLWFINQPIIREYAKLLNAEEGLIGKPIRKEKVHHLIRQRYNAAALKSFNNNADLPISYRTKNSDPDGKRYNFRSIPAFTNYKDSVAALAGNIENFKNHKAKCNTSSKDKLTTEDVNFFGNQLAVLEEFIELTENQASLFKGMATVLNTDSKGLGANVATLVEKRNKLNEIMSSTSKTFNNFHHIFGEVVTQNQINEKVKAGEDVANYVKVGDIYIQPTGIVGSSSVYAVGAFEKIFHKEFIQFSEEYERAISRINGIGGKSTSKQELGKKLIEHYKKYAHSYALAAIGVDIDAEYNRLLVDEYSIVKDEKTGEILSKDTIKKSLAGLIQEMQTGDFANNALIQSIVAVRMAKGKFANITFNNVSGNTDTDGKTISAMYDLINENPILIDYNPDTKKPYRGRDLISDLFIYSEITGGIQRFGELVKFMPHELKKHIGFSDALYDSVDNKPINNTSFITQFIQHNPEFAKPLAVSVRLKEGEDELTKEANRKAIEKASKGLIRASAISNKEVADENGVMQEVIVPIPAEGHSKITHLFVNPFEFQVNDKGTSGPFLSNGEPHAPLMVRLSSIDSKTRISTHKLFKLVLRSDVVNGDNTLEAIDETALEPLITNGQFVYIRVDELGSGNKTEYDASVSPISIKNSALNGDVRRNYKQAILPDSIILDTDTNVAKASFGNYTPAELKQFVRNIMGNKSANPIARTFALLLNKLNVLDNVSVMSQKELLALDPANDSETLAGARYEAKRNTSPMFYYKKPGHSKAYIVVNEDYYDNPNATLEELQQNFVHELGHFIVDSDIVTETDDKGLSKQVSAFRKSGNELVKAAKKAVAATWTHDISLDDVLKYLRDYVEGRSSKVPGNVEHSEFMKVFRKYYGLLDFHEFYAEMASNAEFVDMLGKAEINKAYNAEQSNVISKGEIIYGTSINDGTIIDSFLNLFKNFFNKILSWVSKMSNDSHIEIESNSIARYAMYELFVSASAHQSGNKALNAKLLESPVDIVSDTEEDNSLPNEFLSNNGVAKTTKPAKTESVEGESSYFDKESGKSFNLSDEVPAGFGQSDDTDSDPFGGHFVIGIVDNQRQYNFQKDEHDLTEKDVDKILKGLVDDGRIEYACKL